MKKTICTFALLLPVISLIAFAHNDLPIERESAESFRAAYGGSVAFAGNDIIVSEHSGFSTPGMVHVIRKNENGSWEEVQVLESIAPIPGDGFGSAIGADEGTLMVTMPGDTGAGSVYVFQRNSAGLWERQQIIEMNGGVQADRFGAEIVVMGSHAVISAPGEDNGRGRIHTYMKSGSTWSMMDHLQPKLLSEGAGFGSSLSFAGGLLAVGAPSDGDGKGSVYVYRSENGGHTWSSVGSGVTMGTEESRQFGGQLLTDGSRLYVGQPFVAKQSGQVHVFVMGSSGKWMREGSLVPPVDEGRPYRFGTSMAMSGDRVWISAPGTFDDSGAIFVYARVNERIDRVDVIRYTEAQQPRARGSALAVHGNTAVIGVQNRDYGEGIAIVMEATGTQWKAVREIFRDLGAFERVTGGRVECSEGSAAVWGCDNVDLIAFIPNTELGSARGSRFNDVWGWTDPLTGVEYGMLGHMEGTIFVNLADPENPIVLGELPRTKGSPGSTHRDIKVYKDHAFIVADGAEQHGMQVFDLTILRDIPNEPVVYEPTAMYTNIASAHNIVINEETGFAYTVGGGSGGETCGGALHMINIQDPLHPVFAGCFQDTRTGNNGSGATHDAQCVTYRGPDIEHTGKEICVGYNGTAVSIADVTDKANPVPISVGTYPNSAYVHQGWFTDDHRYFYQNDEADENRGLVAKTRTMIWDVTDLDDPIMIAEFYGKENSTDHNLYVKGDLMYQTNNASGLRIVDIKNRHNPVEIGFFDTTPQNLNVAGFDGTWSSYPYFESGMILITSRREGMFIVKKREVDI